MERLERIICASYRDGQIESVALAGSPGPVCGLIYLNVRPPSPPAVLAELARPQR